MEEVYILLGSNRGDRKNNLLNARNLIAEVVSNIFVSSAIYESQPWGFDDPVFFLNQVIGVNTNITPEQLLDKLLLIENKMGRLRSPARNSCEISGCEIHEQDQRYEARIIDLDILLFGNRLIFTERLMAPHPRLHERMFTLIPLNEVASGYIHPLLKKTIFVLLNECKDRSQVVLSD
ncbi:MAG: 2-amino-4-hydroxy-6-hydroxymethyldihydropteridine diphosphokinase [Bacteroidetes bacterium]|nr:2-amino-4-hydroxy-6-hydroxymethyldihydropteridine diphosphokinase [Bacteroidota bacterium]